MCAFISGAAVIVFVPVYFVWPLFSVIGELGLPSKHQFFWHMPSVSFHALPWAERACNVFIYSLFFLTFNIPFPSSLFWAKLCIHAFNWISSSSWMLYSPILPFWSLNFFSPGNYVHLPYPLQPPTHNLSLKFLATSHSSASFTVMVLVILLLFLGHSPPLFLFQKPMGCKPPTQGCYSVVESSCRPRQPRSVDSPWYHGNGGLENLTL